MIAKVRHGKVYIKLDVPNDTFLEYWANAPFMPLPGCVVFFQTKGSVARETLSWEEGHCVGYKEEFEEGSSTTGSYVCHIVIAAPKLTMSPGGPPQPFVAPAPREHAYVPVPETIESLPVDWVSQDQWADKPRSQAGFLGSRKLTRKELTQWTNRLANECGVKLEILQKGSSILAYMDAHGKQGGFQASTKAIYLRPVPTYYEITHEAKHAEQWHKLGAKQYDEQSRLEKETYVYEELMREKDKLTLQEIRHATGYINDIRRENGLTPLSN